MSLIVNYCTYHNFKKYNLHKIHTLQKHVCNGRLGNTLL